ncbi:MAG: oligosaccharide flippase family protein [Bacteroidia bacterium]|nr:oligosaccharide flippase family protein [Bacteroidia bacterium]MBP7261027.1 oligosaccharide flippase family protein [Bacteroidia bacterium]MBP9179232.1 oligosaccharide flippase family protein [Bacteroidia bacterium]MBP9724346.1 oligosaccharide flippase family protein [Bacteroidia bacterium]
MFKYFIKNTGWVLIANVFTKSIGLLSISFLSKIISSVELGLYNSYLNTSAYINQIADLGASTILQKSSANFKQDATSKINLEQKLSAAFFLGLIANIVLLTAILFNIDKFSHLLFNQNVTDLTYLLVLITIIQFFFQMPSYVLMGIGYFKYYSIRNLLTSSISFIGTTVLAMSYGLNGAILGYMTATIINTIYTWRITFIILKKEGINFSIYTSFRHIKSLLQDGFWFYFGNTLLGAISGLFTITLFSQYISVEDFGFLRIAASINAITAIIPTALLPVTLTIISRKSNKDVFLIKSVQIRYVFSSIFIFTIVLLMFITPLIELLFSSEYNKGLELICPLILINVIILMQGIFSNFLIAEGKMTFLGTISTISIILHIVLSFTLVPLYGNLGYVAAWLIPQSVSHIITSLKSLSINDFYKKHKEIKVFYLAFIPAFVFTILLTFLPTDSTIKTPGYLVVISLYSIFFLRFVVSKYEVELIKSKLYLSK